ncbi:MAG: oxaloacetate decarboxylase [Mediterranea massiliensis]|nr:oxaloacetate decarboxylase [Mediterranea massiliensis]
MDSLNLALLLMVVGMMTVFIILLIVIGLGKSLILFVNKFIPEEEVLVKKSSTQPVPIPAHVLAAITAAVQVVTHGKGKVAKVEKI